MVLVRFGDNEDGGFKVMTEDDANDFKGALARACAPILMSTKRDHLRYTCARDFGFEPLSDLEALVLLQVFGKESYGIFPENFCD